MPIRTFLDLPRNEAGLVERFIGSAYDTVKVVSDNIEAVLAVPAELETLQGLEANVNNSFEIAKAFITEQVAAASSSAADAAQSDANGRDNAAIALDQAEQAKNSASAALSSSQSAQSSLDQATTQANNSASSASASAESANEAKQYRDELSVDVTDIKGRYQSIIDATNSSAESAKQASVSEQNASVSAQEALSSKQVAETLIKTASGAAKTYPDTTQGLAGTTDGQYFNVAGSGDVYSTSYLNKNGAAVLQSAMPSYAYAQSLDTNKVNRSGDTVTGDLSVTGDTSLNKLTVSGGVSANKLSTASMNLYTDHTDFVYANRRTSFQADGNTVWYGTDNAVLTAIMDGNIQTQGIIASASNINATGIVHVSSPNGKSSLDMRSDDDGIVRMFGKNANVNLQRFLEFNPQGNLDLHGSVELMYNANKVFHIGNVGAGSGNDADTFRGTLPTDYTSTARGDQLQQQINGSLSALGLIRPISPNGSTQLDMHADDDGVIKMYAKNANIVWQGFLAFNPQGNLDLYAPNELMFNAHKVAHIGNMGSGSGFDADSVDGLHGADLAKQVDNNIIWNTINNDCIKSGSKDYQPLTINVTADNKVNCIVRCPDGSIRVLWLAVKVVN